MISCLFASANRSKGIASDELLLPQRARNKTVKYFPERRKWQILAAQ